MRGTLKKLKSSFNFTPLGLFLIFAIMQLTTWIPLRYWKIWGGGNFIDSQQILQWSKCYETQGDLVFINQGECSGYIYGSTLLRILSSFQVELAATQFFGYFFMFILAITMSYKTNMFTKYREAPFILLILLSPPVLLLAERGNFDVLMFALIGSAGFLFEKNHQIWALVPLAIATLFKFYSLPLFLLFFLLNHNRKQKIVTFAVAATVSIRVIFDLQLIQTSFPSGHSWKFGVSIWSRYLTQLESSGTSEMVHNLSGFTILFLVFGATYFFLKKGKILNLPQNSSQRSERILFYLFLLTHISCFILGMSFDYRLIFISTASVIYLKSLSPKNDLDSRLVLVLTLIAVWLTYPSSGLEPIGDLATEVLTVILGIRFLQLLKLDLGVGNAK
jgi:hypothetical protein